MSVYRFKHREKYAIFPPSAVKENLFKCNSARNGSTQTNLPKMSRDSSILQFFAAVVDKQTDHMELLIKF